MGVSLRTILIVDDDNLLATVESRWLKNAGYKVLHVLDGETAIKTVDEKKNFINLILMDINLGKGIDGIETAREILKQYDIPLLFLTSNTDKEIVKRTEEISSYGFVVKDSNETVLLASIKVALKLFEVKNELKSKEENNELLNDKFYKLFNTSPNAISLNRLSDGKYIEINSGFTKITGFSASDVIGKSISNNDIDIWENINQRNKMVKILLSNGELSDFEISFKTKQGNIRTGTVSAQIITINNEKCTFSTITDITGHKQMEKAILYEQNLMNSLIDNSPDRIYFKDIQSRFIKISKALADRFNISDPSEVEGKTDFDFFSEEHAKQAYADEKKIIETGIPIIGLEEKETWADGRETWVFTNKLPLLDNNGQIIGTFGISRDITDYKNLVQDLKYEQYLLSSLMNNTPDHIYFKDRYSKFIRINKSQAKRFRLNNPSEAIGKSDFDYFTDEHAQQAYEDEQNVIKTGKPIIGLEEKETWKSGTITWVSSNKLPFWDHSGNIIGTFGISREITERKLAERQLQKYTDELKKLNTTKDKFFSIISHDLKNPFHSINASLELLTGKEDCLTEEEKEGLLNNIYKISKKAYSLLENLLQWSMHQMDKIDFQPESIELDELIEENIFLFNDSALLKNISLSSNIPPDLFVNADRNMLNTILRNLISNAIKFTPEKGKIDINSNIIDGNVEISVTDNGIGISPDNLEKLLQFNQPFSTNGTHNESGTGLGLLLCKEFIEKNNGALCIESNNNKGSKFAFTLPLKTN